MPKVLEQIMIPIAEMQDRGVYLIDARNASVGIWNASTKSFTISRHKWVDNYLFEESHWETGAPYGTAIPIEFIEHYMLGDDVSSIKLEYLNEVGKMHQGRISEITRKLIDSQRESA